MAIMKKLILFLVVILTLYVSFKFYKFKKQLSESGINVESLIQRARTQQSQDQEFIKKEMAKGKTYSEVRKILIEAEAKNLHKKEEWREMICRFTATRTLDQSSVYARVRSRIGAIFLYEKVNSWNEILRKETIAGDQTLVWLQNIIMDLSSIDALSNPQTAINDEAIQGIKTYADYLHTLCNKGKNSTWRDSCSEWAEISAHVDQFVSKIRQYWIELQTSGCSK